VFLADLFSRGVVGKLGVNVRRWRPILSYTTEFGSHIVEAGYVR